MNDNRAEFAHDHGAILKSIRPGELDWKPFAAFPPAAKLAVVLGRPSEPGLYVVRIKLPGGVKLMPHRHPENRIYTVMSGTFYIGVGMQFDAEALTPYSPGSVVLLPGGTWHFHWARWGEYVTQVMGIGPLGMEYMDLDDDPRVPR
jgi:quercetin dioxygenase-like cupin family protein